MESQPHFQWDLRNKEEGLTRNDSWFSVLGKLSSDWTFMTRKDDSVAAKAMGVDRDTQREMGMGGGQ